MTVLSWLNRRWLTRRRSRNALIRNSGLFDAEWYLASYPDVAKAGVDPALHYLTFGVKEGRFPNPLFDTRWYLEQYRLHGRFRPNPLIDYLRHARSGNRDPNPYFSTSFYLRNNPDVAKSGMNPLVHFLRHGASEGREPGPDFSLRGYIDLNPDAAGDPYNPLAHFLHVGQHQGRSITRVEEPLVKRSHLRCWMNPALASSEWDAKWGRRFRSVVFALGCALYVRDRGRSGAADNRVARTSAWTFLHSAVRRFQAEGVQSASVSSALLLTRPIRIEGQMDYAERIRASPGAGMMLFVVQGLKAVGYFKDAEAICRGLAEARRLRDLALVALGDLYLTQAIWASEYQSYAVHGAAINPHRIVGSEPGRSWHDRSFQEAIDVLRQAADENPANSDAWSLLVLAYRLDESWAASLEANERFASLRPGGGEADLARARALFGMNETAGLRMFEHAVSGSRDRLSIGVARIIEDPCLLDPSRLLALKPAVGPATVSIEYTLVAGGTSVPVCRDIELPEEHLLEVGDARLLPEYGAVLVGGDTLVANLSHMRRCHDAIFTSGLEAIANGNALYCTARPLPADAPVACFIGNNANYFHWLLEDLPRVEMLLDTPAYDHLPILVDNAISGWQIELLRRVGVAERRLCRVDFQRPVEVRHLVLPPRLSKNLVVHPHAIAFLRDRLIPGSPQLEPKPGKRLYLTRETASVQRGMSNEPEVRERLRKAGFIAVDPGKLSGVDDHIKLFSDVEVIAAAGGAALSNLLYAPSKAKVLVLSADAILSETFTSLASVLGQAYTLCTGTSAARAHRHWIWTRFDFSIAKEDLELALERTLSP